MFAFLVFLFVIIWLSTMLLFVLLFCVDRAQTLNPLKQLLLDVPEQNLNLVFSMKSLHVSGCTISVFGKSLPNSLELDTQEVA